MKKFALHLVSWGTDKEMKYGTRTLAVTVCDRLFVGQGLWTLEVFDSRYPGRLLLGRRARSTDELGHPATSLARRSLDQKPSVAVDRQSAMRGNAQVLMSEVEATWLAMVGISCWWMRIIDAKGFTVSGISGDADAGYGRAAGGMAKGYKFFAVWGGGPLPLAWALGPMNKSEKTMARHLIAELPGEGYLVADTEYDSNALYDLAHQAGYQLLAPKRQRQSPVGHRRQSPYRMRSIHLMKRKFGRQLFRFRRQIERDFGGLTSFGSGLSPLPAWVRRFPRVRNWVHAKLLINAVRWLRANLPAALAVA